MISNPNQQLYLYLKTSQGWGHSLLFSCRGCNGAGPVHPISPNNPSVTSTSHLWTLQNNGVTVRLTAAPVATYKATRLMKLHTAHSCSDTVDTQLFWCTMLRHCTQKPIPEKICRIAFWGVRRTCWKLAWHVILINSFAQIPFPVCFCVSDIQVMAAQNICQLLW